MEEYEYDTIGIIRGNEFSNYFYNQSTNYNIKIELGLPIFDFSECLNKIKENLTQTNNTNIYVRIMDYND